MAADGAPVLILNPTGYLEDKTLGLAPRVGELQGKTLAVLDDTLAYSEDLLERVSGILKEEHGIGRVIRVRKPNLSAPTPVALLEQLVSEADVAVVGVGG